MVYYLDNFLNFKDAPNENYARELMELFFTPSESTFSYFAATRQYLEQHGRPVAFYSDKNSIFKVNIKQALTDSGGVVAHAAKRLGMRRTTLVEKLRKYGLQRQT